MTAYIGITLCKLWTLVYPLNATDVTKEGLNMSLLVLLFQMFWTELSFGNTEIYSDSLVSYTRWLAWYIRLFFSFFVCFLLSCQQQNSRRCLKAKTFFFFFLADLIFQGKGKLYLCLWFILVFSWSALKPPAILERKNRKSFGFMLLFYTKITGV